ncbi:MAG TPA: FAD/NAD(P)-binding protein [bacterium]|nr:FAD/NAD(P)-binding protein [bacterium]
MPQQDAQDPMVPQPFRVAKLWKDTSDTFTVEIEPADGYSRPPFLPGQFNMLYIFGTGEIPISISGDPAKKNTFLHTTRVVGTVTQAMRALKRGGTIGVRGPFGSSWPMEQAAGKDVVIVAGGIGLAPLRPAIYALLHERQKYGQIVLLYGARTREDMLYTKELETWRKGFNLDVHVTVDRATGNWQGPVGVVPSLIPRAPFDPLNTVAMVCGPEIMMRFTLKALQKRGIADEDIFLSMERNMKCAVGFCGHCQYGPTFICKDGPVFCHDRISWIFSKREV